MQHSDIMVIHYSQCFKCQPAFLKCRPTFRFEALTATTSHPHLKRCFGKCWPTFMEKSDMSANISGKCRPTFREKPNMLVGLRSWSN